jgi:hypothetical protein
VFTGFYPVALVVWLIAMIWLGILFMRARSIPAAFFVEQPPSCIEAFNSVMATLLCVSLNRPHTVPRMSSLSPANPDPAEGNE